MSSIAAVRSTAHISDPHSIDPAANLILVGTGRLPDYRRRPGRGRPGNSFVYIPSLKAVVTGDIVFDHVYFGVPRDAARENWLKTIDQIAALKPDVVVPGHEGPGATRTMAAVDFMKQYIADWDASVKRSKDAIEMRANVLKQYPLLGMEFTLTDRVATYFPAAAAK